MRNLLILGGTGFIGRNIVEKLLTDDCRVVLVTRRNNLKFNTLYNPRNLIIIPGKIGDCDLIKSLLKEYKVDTVIHLVSNLIPASTYDEFNVELEEVILPTFELIHHAAQERIRFIFFSSGGTIYGKSNDLIRENHELNPINYYGYSKLLIEAHIRFLERIGNLRYTIIRPSNAYGKYQRSQGNQGFIGISLKKVISNEPITIWGDGKVIRDFVYVDDLAEIIKKIIYSAIGGETYNIGSGQGKTLLEIIELMCNYCNKDVEIQWADSRSVDVNRTILDIAKVQYDFGFAPTPIEVGLKEFIDWIKINEK